LFEKARRKVEETKFFLHELRGDQHLQDAMEFRFNALLNAGKNVVNAIHAQIFFCEEQILKPSAPGPCEPTQAPKVLRPLCLRLSAWRERRHKKRVIRRERKAYRLHFKTWRRTRTAEERDQFDVLQALRNIEVHGKEAVSQHVPRSEEGEEWSAMPSDQRYAAVFAQYMAMGMLSSKVATFKTTYTFEVDPSALSDRREHPLFKRFAAAPKSQVDLGQTYADLLTSLVDHFSTQYT
jgi:hypothetical protein